MTSITPWALFVLAAALLVLAVAGCTSFDPAPALPDEDYVDPALPASAWPGTVVNDNF